jgi:hypothetical protein
MFGQTQNGMIKNSPFMNYNPLQSLSFGGQGGATMQLPSALVNSQNMPATKRDVRDARYSPSLAGVNNSPFLSSLMPMNQNNNPNSATA